MRAKEFILEGPQHDLAKQLPSLSKHTYNSIDQLMGKVASKHGLAKKALHNLFVKTYKKTPDDWIKGFTEDENDTNDDDDNHSIQSEVKKCAIWTGKKLGLSKLPKFDLSNDTEDAQSNHHTGSHIQGHNSIWVYVKNRNLVDILRTTMHELVHLRQDELGQIKDGDSYPGSPIEVEADAVAGALIKVYGKENPHIFQ